MAAMSIERIYIRQTPGGPQVERDMVTVVADAGPPGDLSRRPPAALQMLAVGAARPALCALPEAVC